jgi:hypothetical protein
MPDPTPEAVAKAKELVLVERAYGRAEAVQQIALALTEKGESMTRTQEERDRDKFRAGVLFELKRIAEALERLNRKEGVAAAQGTK